MATGPARVRSAGYDATATLVGALRDSAVDAKGQAEASSASAGASATAAATARLGAENARDEAVAARDLASEIALGDADAALAGGILNNASSINQALADEFLDTSGPFGQIVGTRTVVSVAAATGVAVTDRTRIQAAITAAGAADGVAEIRLARGSTYLLDQAITGLDDVVLNLNGATLKIDAALNADVIYADTLDNFHVLGGEIDGNGINQTGTALSGDDETITGRGIALMNCTRSSVRHMRVHHARLHGVLIYGGSDNSAEDVVADFNGSLSSTRYGNGFFVWNSPRFRGRGITASDNNANSGVVTKGGANCADVSLTGIVTQRNGGSGISLNSLRATLSHWSTSDTRVGFAGLNLGHDTSSGLYCDDFNVTDGTSYDNGSWGINIDGAIGGHMANVTSRGNGYHNLRIYGGRAGHLAFTNCDFDTTTINNTPDRGQSVDIDGNGVPSPVGHIRFTGCRARGALRTGVRVNGVSDVYWIGGSMEDNADAGLLTVDDGANLTARVVCISTVFRDTRTGVARTQSNPFSLQSTGGKCAVLGYYSDNHPSSDSGVMVGATSDVAFGGYHGAAQGMVPLTPLGGTAAAPAYAFKGRTNQGMFTLGSNTVGFAAAGVEQGRYDQARWQFATPVRPGIYATGSRPSASAAGDGAMIYDSTLDKPLWSDGTTWRDATGTAV